MKRLNADFVIIGSGLAGSVAAYLLSRQGTVLLLSKGLANQSNSFAAQGGIAAAIGANDHARMHAHDTYVAGIDLCDRFAVDHLTDVAPKVIAWLQEIGVQFDTDPAQGISLGLEGAHSRRRILHAGGDATGRNMMETLTHQLQRNSNIRHVENVQVVSLVQNAARRVTGAVGLLEGASHEQTLFAGRRAVILASGGAGQLFARSTNPAGATGDGVALAYQVGARIRNMEFIQFHPTALDLEGYPSFLISEAIRGAGGTLVNQNGERIMSSYPQGDLESRDVVARGIYRRMQNAERIYLDCGAVRDFAKHFPTIFARCLQYGIDARHEPIPVSPAAHFMMGGIRAEINGKTDIAGLYAIGEVASTGVHGANRLASNSLLECAVMAFALADHLQSALSKAATSDDDNEVIAPTFMPDPADLLNAVKVVMWETGGIIRDRQSLQKGVQMLKDLGKRYTKSAALCTAELILRSALSRQESRGAHFRSDFPHLDSRLNYADTESELTGDGGAIRVAVAR